MEHLRRQNITILTKRYRTAEEYRRDMEAMNEDPSFISVQTLASNRKGHVFEVGQEVEVHGMETSPEFNGTTAKITAYREDGPNGRAYYIEGDVNKHFNWLYEYRLKAKEN